MKPELQAQAKTLGVDLAEALTAEYSLHRRTCVRAAVFTLALEMGRLDNEDRDKPLSAVRLSEYARSVEREFALRSEQLTERT